MYEYNAKIIRIVDGDGFIADVDLGFYTHCHKTFRLKNYEAPEITGPERKLGLIAKTKLEELLPPGAEVMIQTEKQDGFRRWLAEVSWEGGSLTEYLIKHGYGLFRGKNDKRPIFDLEAPYPLIGEER